MSKRNTYEMVTDADGVTTIYANQDRAVASYANPSEAQVELTRLQIGEAKRLARNAKARVARKVRAEICRSLGLSRNCDGSWE